MCVYFIIFCMFENNKFLIKACKQYIMVNKTMGLGFSYLVQLFTSSMTLAISLSVSKSKK